MIKVIDDVEKYVKKDYWILNYFNFVVIVFEVCCKLRLNVRIINICDMLIVIIDMIVGLLNINDVYNICYDYFGLNYFGWFILIDYKYRDLMEEIKEYIKENKILLLKFYIENLNKSCSIGNCYVVSSWIYVWEFVYIMLESFLKYLLNIYLIYYFLSKEIVEYLNINCICVNEVMESCEKDLFEGVRYYLEIGEIFEKVFYVGLYGDWISDLVVLIKNDICSCFLVIIENCGVILNMLYDVMVEILVYIGKDGLEVIVWGLIFLF